MSESSTQRPNQENLAIDIAKSSFSDLWKKEDYLAIWLGFIILVVGLVIFLPRPPANMNDDFAKFNSILKQEASRAPFKTIAWHEASEAKKKIRVSDQPFAKSMKVFFAAPGDWSINPVEALFMSAAAAEEKNQKGLPLFNELKAAAAAALTTARASEEAAAAANFSDAALNEKASADIGAWQKAAAKASKAKAKTANKAYNRFGSLAGLAVILAMFFGIGMRIMGKSFGKFFVGFFFVFIIAVLAYTAEVQHTMKTYGFGFPLWAIVFGMLISNTIGTPEWVKPAVQTEYYIKTGLVLLGVEILFGKIVTIGIPGIFVAWVVTPIVLVCTYVFGQKVLKIPSKTLNITISADMSVCGVSAAIATAAACRAKKEELTLAVGLSLVFTSIMMVAMPAFIRLVDMPEILGGAWIGGTIDASGAVAAAGEFLGEKALYVAATIKMIQNVLIGVIAFCVAAYWCFKVDREAGRKVGPMEIWYRFPKFVLGFIGASIAFSLIYAKMGPDVGYAMIDNGVIGGLTKHLRGWFFCLAFTSIGLATDFRELKHYFKGGKPLILYVCGQTFNLCLTLLMAYIMFYVVFTRITTGL